MKWARAKDNRARAKVRCQGSQHDFGSLWRSCGWMKVADHPRISSLQICHEIKCLEEPGMCCGWVARARALHSKHQPGPSLLQRCIRYLLVPQAVCWVYMICVLTFCGFMSMYKLFLYYNPHTTIQGQVATVEGVTGTGGWQAPPKEGRSCAVPADYWGVGCESRVVDLPLFFLISQSLWWGRGKYHLLNS